MYVLLFYSTFFMAQEPANYYDNALGKTGYTLKTALKEIITNGYVSYSYDDLYTIYLTSDKDDYYENDGTVLDIYSEKPQGPDAYEYVHIDEKCGTYSTEGDCYNREHIVPQSVFDSASPMVSDAHFVVPTDGYVNGRRSNYPFGEVSDPTWTSTNGSKVGPNSTSGYVDTVFEPIDEFKGDIARMLFYFATRYEDQVASWSHPMFNGTSDQVFSDWFLDILLDWNQQDPVSQREIDRNNAVYEYQNNRNPFIDHPEWVSDIWGGTSSDGDSTGSGDPVVIKLMDFDGTTPEWAFTSNTTFFDNGSDGFFGIYNANNDPYDGQPTDTGVANASDIDVINYNGIVGDFLFVNDLDDEGDNGTTGEALIQFESVDVQNYSDLSFSFDYDMSGFDSTDYIRYELYEDGVSIGEQTLTNNTEGTFVYNITPGTQAFYAIIKIKQNGASDQAAIDNVSLKGIMNTSEPACIPATLNLVFDNYPEETSWTLYDSNNQLIDEGGPYDTEPQGGSKTISFCLDPGCYTFTIKDSYGDGMCCDYGSGSYSLVEDDTQNVLASGGSFASIEETDFCVGVALRPVQNDYEETQNIFNIYPSPVIGELNLQISDPNMDTVEILDTNGRLILHQTLKTKTLNLQDLSPGIYFIKISSYKKALIKRFIKQ